MKRTTGSGAVVSIALLGQRIAEGQSFLRAGRIEDALQLARTLPVDWPGQPQAHAFLAEAYNLNGDFSAALECIDCAIRQAADPQYKVKKAWLLSRALRRDEMLDLVAELAAEAGQDALLLWQIGKLYYVHNRLPDAIAQYERSLQVKDAANVRYDLAIARFYSGDAEQAERDLDSLLSGRPDAGSVLYLRSTVRAQTEERNHVAELQALLATHLAPKDEACVLYALAKELEDLGEHDQSFSVLERAAKKRRDTFEYDVASVVGGLREIIDSTDAVAMAAVESGHEESGAIFILGMPRTGTTLTERMLLQSSRVGNAGELTDFELLLGSAMRRVHAEAPSLSSTEAALKIDFSALGRAYMQAARPMAGGGERFIDKMPANFMYCGMIAKALPNAKIIHLVRDPLDTCFAIYKTLFFKAYEFSYALDELAEYYIAYHRLMRHWHEIMPGRILDVSYEDLVTDTEVQARRLYDWCGLEWTEDALKVPSKRTVYATASAAQVRGPVHSRSVGSSRRHLERLAPLVEKLVAAGIMSSP